MAIYKGIYLNNGGYVYTRLKNNINNVIDLFNKFYNEEFNCDNINEKIYCCLIFHSNKRVIVFDTESIYIFACTGDSSLPSEIYSLHDCIMSDLRWLSIDFDYK